MKHIDDPMRSQHLDLGTEAFPGWQPFPGHVSQPLPVGDERRKVGGLVTRLTGNSLLSLALIFSGNAQADPEPAEHPIKGSEFTMAMQHYEDSHWQEAFGRFAALAQQGHGEAARMAWQMWRYGPELFGIEFPADANQRQLWLAAWRGTPLMPRQAQAAATP
jgi:hypothetical protein